MTINGDKKRLKRIYYVLAGTFATVLIAVELVITHSAMVTSYTVG